MNHRSLVIAVAVSFFAVLARPTSAADGHIGVWQLVEPNPVLNDGSKIVRLRIFRENGLYEQQSYMPSVDGRKFLSREIGTWTIASGNIRVTYTETLENGKKLESKEEYELTKDGKLSWPRLKKTFSLVKDEKAPPR